MVNVPIKAVPPKSINRAIHQLESLRKASTLLPLDNSIRSVKPRLVFSSKKYGIGASISVANSASAVARINLNFRLSPSNLAIYAIAGYKNISL